MDKVLNLRSDTVTKPTEEMYRAMAEAELGDDVSRDDPTVNRLEELAAEKIGKEAALFVASGTMGNLCAIVTHTHPRESLLCESRSHTYEHEVGGAAALGGLLCRTIWGERGFMAPEAIRQEIHDPEDVHVAPATLLCIENTHNAAGGVCLSAEQMKTMADTAHAHGLKVHTDGARIFNSAVAQGVPAADLVAESDSVMFCLSKGLSSPVGSLLTGRADFIKEARRVRKMVGGGMRQAGILAACGIVSLTKMVDRLAEDHANARLLAEGLAELPGVEIDLGTVQTNLVFFRPPGDPDDFLQRCAEVGVLGVRFPNGEVRLSLHRHVAADDVKEALRRIGEIWPAQ
jgi:threonine aldolase